jgi:hypothetical protein
MVKQRYRVAKIRSLVVGGNGERLGREEEDEF